MNEVDYKNESNGLKNIFYENLNDKFKNKRKIGCYLGTYDQNQCTAN